MPGDTSNSSVRIRRRTAAWFTANNLILFEAQFGYETDTKKMKLGDGVTPWNDLPYMDTDVSDDGAGGETPVGLPYIFQADYQTDPASGLFIISDISPAEGDQVFLGFNSIDATTTDRESVLMTLSAGGLIYLNTAGDDTAVAVFKATYCAAGTGDNGPTVVVVATYLSGALPNDGGAVRVTIAPVEVTGVKRYVALLTQSGTDAPVATVLENSLGGTVVWTYEEEGSYMGTLPGAFPDNKVAIQINLNSDEPFNKFVSGYFVTGDAVYVICMNGSGSYTNNLLSGATVSISVYP